MQHSNPIISAHLMDDDVLFNAMKSGIKGMKIEEIAKLAECYLMTGIGKAERPIEFADFATTEKLAAIAGLAGWRAKETRYPRVSDRTLAVFQKLTLEYLGLKTPALLPIEICSLDELEIQSIPQQAESSGLLEAMYCPDANIKEGSVTIPLKNATNRHALDGICIKSKRVYIPADSFKLHFKQHSKNVFEALVKIVDTGVEYKVKTKLDSSIVIFKTVLELLANQHGPWILKDVHEKPYPMVELIMKALEASGNKNTPVLIHGLVKDIKEYQPDSRAPWESRERDAILNMSSEGLLSTLIQYKKENCAFIRDIQKPALGPQKCIIRFGKPERMKLTEINDFDRLSVFPCFARAVKDKAVPHQMRAAMFSTLLWFYDVDRCIDIIENKIGVPNFDRERSRYQLNSLLESDSAGRPEPKYCYGVRGFAPYCIGYEKCPRCWILGLRMPERYYEKKKEMMLNKNNC
ncbi:MAG: hypothetical protein OI715_00585 (plasmid) [Candidatus Methanoperedens sp.]|nr:MAG: hypothetical protein OI715_00585 [Candidatus Methanoperedens sp.]